MTNWFDVRPTFTELGTSIAVARPAFVASFYAHGGFMPHALPAFDEWLTLLPAKSTVYYGHEKTKRYLKASPKSTAKVRDALSVASITEMYQWYHAKTAAPDGPADECHAYSFEVKVSAGSTSYLYLTFPLDHVATTGADAVIEWFSRWCADFGFTNAGAGYGFEVAWFGEQAQRAYPALLPLALRFHGLRLWQRHHARFRERSPNTLDTAAWLTYLDRTSIEALEPGALERIDAGVQRHPCGSGVVLQAGPAPEPCDTNRRDAAYALLKSVNDAIVPIRTLGWWINGFGGEPDKENGWFERMDR